MSCPFYCWEDYQGNNDEFKQAMIIAVQYMKHFIYHFTMMNLVFKNYELLRLLRNLNCWDICSFLSLKVGLKNPLGAEFCLNLCHSFDSNVQVGSFTNCTYGLLKRHLLTGAITSLWDLCNSHLEFSKQKNVLECVLIIFISV